MYLKETFYCTLHLKKNGSPVSGASVFLNIMRNSDGKFLKPSTGNWNLTEDNIPMIEKLNGIYQYDVDMASFNDKPDSYTLIYKYDNNGVTITESEQLYYERKNRARLV